ncbi:MAG TPA: hypothetical protein VFN67_31185 [Polyangiales bacterium]|nr:hypothetical protein [Polyangiales bacterium]
MNGSGAPPLTLFVLASLCMCASAGCERQLDLVALRHNTERSCAMPGTCPDSAAKDAGRAPEPDCDATNTCTSEQQPAEPGTEPAQTAKPPCAGAPACSPPPAVVERCETRVCESSAQSDNFCTGDGAVLTLGDGCATQDKNPEFRFALCSETDLIVKAPLHVTGSVAVDSIASLSADVQIEGDLRYGRLQYEPGTPEAVTHSTMQASTTCTLPSSLSLDVAQIVKAHASDNDNDQASEDIARLARWSGEQSITLPCGRYYLSEIDGDGSMTVNAMGNVVVFVDGGVSAKQGLHFRAATGARVSLVVKGSVHVIGGLQLGELSDARHLLLAGGQIHLEQGKNTIGGVLYSQTEDVLLVNGTLDVKGALFAHRAQLEGATSVVHAPAEALAADSCQPDA